MLLILGETRATPGEGTGKRSSYRIPFKNSAKFPKDMRPLHLQDDEIFDALSLESVTNQMAIWSQTKATQEATALKAKKNDKTGNKENTQIKIVKVQEGNHDATKNHHPQKYAMRPSVVGQEVIWDKYPTHWPEVYYAVNLSDVGLENQLGHKQMELLHDRRSKIEIKYFASPNANIGRSGFKTTNFKALDNGTTEVTARDNWAGLNSINDLMMALDNLVAAWACFWEGEQGAGNQPEESHSEGHAIEFLGSL